MSPTKRLGPLLVAGSMRRRRQMIRAEGQSRLRLARVVRSKGGGEEKAVYLEREALVMFRALARSILLARGIPYRTKGAVTEELRRAPSFILLGSRP